MQQVMGVIRWILAEFGPLVMFWSLDLTLGLRMAIAGSVLFILADAAWRFRQGLPFTRLYLLVSALTVVFGSIDLLSVSPFMLKYEAVITNLIVGAMFVAGAKGPRPLLMELSEKRLGESFGDRPDMVRFFQIFTLLWAAYFMIKAGLYFAVGELLPMARAMALRSIAGSVSLGLMVALSMTQGRRLYMLCRWLGLLPKVAAPETK